MEPVLSPDPRWPGLPLAVFAVSSVVIGALHTAADVFVPLIAGDTSPLIPALLVFSATVPGPLAVLALLVLFLSPQRVVAPVTNVQPGWLSAAILIGAVGQLSLALADWRLAQALNRVSMGANGIAVARGLRGLASLPLGLSMGLAFPLLLAVATRRIGARSAERACYGVMTGFALALIFRLAGNQVMPLTMGVMFLLAISLQSLAMLFLSTRFPLPSPGSPGPPGTATG